MTSYFTRRVAAALVLAGVTAGAATSTADARNQNLAQSGTSAWEDFPCFPPRTGRCQFNLRQGSLTGTPIADGTYTITIDDNGAANPDTCVPAIATGLFGPREPDQAMVVRGTGQVCPDGSGGFTFSGTYRLDGGSGRFRSAKGSGELTATMRADRSSSLSMTGTVRGIR